MKVLIGCLSVILIIVIGGFIASNDKGGGNSDQSGRAASAAAQEQSKTPPQTVSNGGGSILETRRMLFEHVTSRTGPGTDYPLDSTGEIFPEEPIYVLENRGDWIRFRVSPKDLGWSGWVRKDQTALGEPVLPD